MGLLSDPYPLLLRTSLALALLGGFGLGLAILLSFAFRWPLPGSVGALIQTHGQVQALGFVGLFVMAVATRLMPRLHGAQLVDAELISVGGLTVAAGVILRAVTPAWSHSPPRDALVALSGLLTLWGIVLALYAFGRTVRGGTRRQAMRPLLLPFTMVSSLLAALMLNLAASIGLASAWDVVPPALNEAILHLELWGFASTMILAIARNTWPNLLLLPPAASGALLPALVFWGIGSLGVPLTWLFAANVPGPRALMMAAQLAGALLYVVGLRLFEPPARASSLPRVTNPARAWARVAFGFLLASAAMNVTATVGELGNGFSATFTSLSAARHALAQGFVLPVIVLMASRILPGYSASMMRHPRVFSGLMWGLFAGALLRAGGEAIGGYTEGWNIVVACGATLSTVAFVIFAVGLWREAGRTTDRPSTYTRVLPTLS